MTSTANPQNVPAPTSNASSATASYASAVGASGKAAATPVIATGSSPVVVGSSTPSSQPANHHAKSSSVSPLNGNAANKTSSTTMANKPIIPAVPTVINGSSATPTSVDHSRKSSVTISAAGPSGYLGNGVAAGAAGKAGLPKFGYVSPAVAHSTPSQNPAVPIPIPGHQQRIPSPAHSPSPIPQPSASGGRPPSTIAQDGATMKFGSLGGDGDRHMKHNPSNLSQTNMPIGNQSPHFRRGSTHSVQSDVANHAGNHLGNHNNHNHGNHGHHGGPGPNRGGYPQAGRGRGYNNNHQFNQSIGGYPPGGGQYPRGPSGQGRGGMAPQFQPRNVMQPGYGPNSPQAARVSPAVTPAIPNNGTPHMQAAIPANPSVASAYMGYPYQQPAGFPPVNNYPYPPQYNNPGMMGYPAYGQMNAFMTGPQQSPGPVYSTPYGGQYGVPGGQPMSRNSSQVSERPNSSTGQVVPPVTSQGAPAIISVTAGIPSKAVSAAAPSTTFVKPRKSAAIVIKNAQGEVQDFNSFKAQAPPASPVPKVEAVSKTPPIIASTPTPPPKAPTSLHVRNESTTAAEKTAEQRRNEFKEKVLLKAQDDASEEKATPVSTEEEKPAAAVVEEEKKEEPASKKPAEDAAAAPKAAAEDKPAVAKTEAAKKEPAAAAPAAEDEEDELERQIREMEEAEAKREAEEAAYTAKKKIEDAEKKKKADADRAAHAADNDRKLREQEREMERLEEERERQRKANEASVAAGGNSKSVAEALAEKISSLTLSDRKESAAATDAAAGKAGDLKASSRSQSTTASPTTETSSGKRAKPSALNLAPLNTKSVEPPQPSAALQSLKTARFLRDPMSIAYPKGIQSPNPALNPAASNKGNFKYDMGFLLQFKGVFTEKPSLDFDQQVKQLIGDNEGSSRGGSRTPASSSVRQNSRSNASGFGMGGVMGEFSSKPLPPGTTSEQRFAMSSGSMPRPAVPGISQFGRPGGFPGPSHMSRTPSSSMGGVPHSPRQGSRSTRGGSRRDGFNGKSEAQAAKTMPLTQGQELKPIVVTATGWKPSSIGNRNAQNPTAVVGASGNLDPAVVQRKVKAALNKMTPEKFDKISDQILTIALQSKDEEDGRTLRQVIQLTFEKATDEAHWASMYARFCKRMLDMMSPEIRDTTIKDKNGNVVSGGTLFRKYLLNRCQEEFERGWKMDLPQPKEGESKEAVMLSDEYYEVAAAKRRGLGLVQFIGELYKLGMLTERIMHECVRKLVDYETVPDEAEIESLSKLLRTVGANLDHTEKGRPMMDAYFVRIKNMIDIPELPSRLKFMLMDIVDIRHRNWVSNEVNKGPKTLEEIRQEAEAAAAAKAAETARSHSQRGGGGRPGMGGRGDSRQFSYNQPAPNQVGMDDLRRLKGSASRIASSGLTTLGPTSMFASRSNSGRRNGPGGSFGRTGDDSGPASRTGTPPTRGDSNSVSHSNAFEALANVDTETPTSPPSTAASPAISKAHLDKAGGKKDGN